VSEHSCVAVADGIPLHGWAVLQHTQQRVLAHPLTETCTLLK
jgi:hypothetical protein